MHIKLTPDSPIGELSLTPELLSFVSKHQFTSMRKMMLHWMKKLHTMEDFDYRLQHQIVCLLEDRHWQALLD